MYRYFLLLKAALRAITRNKLRSSLTVLGIIIGVGAVIAMVGIGEGASNLVKSQISSLGDNLITIHSEMHGPGGRSSGGGSGSALTGFLVYAAYAAGIALVVGVLAVAVALASTTVVARMRTVLPYINRISGAILAVVGVYVAYYGWFELRLFAGGSAQDPVIAAAGRVQGTVAGWVYRGGAWPWLVALVALVALAGTAWALQRRRRRAVPNPPTRLDSPV